MNTSEKIKRSIESGNISHAYIFEGSSFSDKESAALSFLEAISGGRDITNNPDFHEVRATKEKGRTVSSIKDDDMEELQAQLKLKPHGDRNLALIYDADSMTVKAQNRFLKTLEEPTPGTVILMLSENTENLLETIRSRCVIYRFYSDEGRLDEADEDFSEIFDGLAGGAGFHQLKKLIQKKIRSREDAYEFLDYLELRMRDVMTGRTRGEVDLRKDRAIDAIELSEEARRELDGNAIYGYTIRKLILKIQENQ